MPGERDRTTDSAALWCDEYELTMAQSFWEHGQHQQRACFELFVRKLPLGRGYLIAAGLQPVLDFLADFRFTAEDLEFLRQQGKLKPTFIDHLAGLRFTGDINAVSEGTPVGARTPLLQVIAAREQATLIESAVLALINHQTTIATKAARIVTAAAGKPVWDFSMRRVHGLGPAVGVARSAFIGGCAGSATVAAGRDLGIPTTGTMAHHYVLAFGEDDEQRAFEQFLGDFPELALVLVDTFDVDRGVARAIAASQVTGVRLKGIRIDSGDIAATAQRARAALDAAGMNDTLIVASNDLDEYRISEFESVGAPIDSYGVGTMLGTSADAPALGGVYKLVAQEQDGIMTPVMKRSAGKVTDPGVHQVWRTADGDVLGFVDEELVGTPLLQAVVRQGAACAGARSLEQIRAYCAVQRATLPAAVRRLADPEVMAAQPSARLSEVVKQLSKVEVPV